jgi:hypothetical protein
MLEGIKIGLIKLIKRIRPTSTVYGLHQQLKRGYLGQQGWVESWYQKKAIDKNGEAIPWLTYPCVDFLNGRVDKEINVFEYGSGSSTIWFSRKVKKLVSCEHDQSWYEKVKNELGEVPNVELIYRNLDTGSEYEEEIKKQEKKFDLILIDGRRRNKCGINSIEALSENGVIIWDNSDREEYSEGTKFLTDSGYKKLDFFGPTPGSFRGSCTSIFYRSTNCLKI